MIQFIKRKIQAFAIHIVSGSINNMLDTIHDNLMEKGFDCFNADDSVKEVDEYKLTFKDVREELAKYYR